MDQPDTHALLKAHIDQYTRKDGTVVQAHDDKRVAAKPNDRHGHPNVVGKAEKLRGGNASEAHGFEFAGKEFRASGKTGKSAHDGTPVRHFREATEDGRDTGQHVWLDDDGRVHADSTDEVGRLRREGEAHAAASKAALPASSVSVAGEDRYAFANGGKPSGAGTWMFSPHKSVDFSKHKAGEDYFQSPHGTKYSDAKKQAKAWAAQKGHSEVHVQT